jgi:dipeptidyl aminopeptidase/acylaminoacyl peptidase
LPDGRQFLFHAAGTQPGVYLAGLGTSESPRRILDVQAGAYASSGHLFFVRQGALFAQRFDPGRLELTGDSIPVAEQVAGSDAGGAVALSVSAAGPIAYRTGPSTNRSQFVWFDRSGTALETVVGSDVGTGFNASLSPDGRRLAMSRNVGGLAADIWLLDLDRHVPSRFTFDEAFDLMPVWSPDSTRIAFSSNRRRAQGPTFDVYEKSVSGVGDERLLVAHDGGDQPTDWSADGRFILYNRETSAGLTDIWALPLDGDRKPFPVVETMFDETNGQFSPNGRWIAYQGNATGQSEIYVQPFPGPGQRTRISSNGGVQVRWRHDGQELFYLAPTGQLMAVSIRLDSADVGAPVPLFRPQVGGRWRNALARNYMVSRDGRFLMETLKEVTIPVTVILNWKHGL